jgi:hypothetical protein
MKRVLLGLVIIGIIVLGMYYPIVWWITGIAILLIVVFFVWLISGSDKREEERMIEKFGKDYKDAKAQGKLGFRTPYPCKPDEYHTSKKRIEDIAKIQLPDFCVKECMETLEDFTGDYSGEATIEFSVPIDDDIITQIEDGMQEDGSLWRKGENGEYVCDLLKPYVGEPVTDEYWTLLIQENKREGIIRYGRV